MFCISFDVNRFKWFRLYPIYLPNFPSRSFWPRIYSDWKFCLDLSGLNQIDLQPFCIKRNTKKKFEMVWNQILERLTIAPIRSDWIPIRKFSQGEALWFFAHFWKTLIGFRNFQWDFYAQKQTTQYERRKNFLFIFFCNKMAAFKTC